MAGLMMSHKTLHGLPTKWSSVFPPKESIKDIFAWQNPLVMNTLHYADYEGVEIASSLELATEFAGPHLDALQLDMIWPHPRLLAKQFLSMDDFPGIPQAGEDVARSCRAGVNNNPNLLASRLAAYGATIDYVLLDKSMGTGKGLDANFLQPFIAKIKNALPNLGIVIAGGLGPETMLLVQPLAAEFE